MLRRLPRILFRSGLFRTQSQRPQVKSLSQLTPSSSLFHKFQEPKKHYPKFGSMFIGGAAVGTTMLLAVLKNIAKSENKTKAEKGSLPTKDFDIYINNNPDLKKLIEKIKTSGYLFADTFNFDDEHGNCLAKHFRDVDLNKIITNFNEFEALHNVLIKEVSWNPGCRTALNYSLCRYYLNKNDLRRIFNNTEKVLFMYNRLLQEDNDAIKELEKKAGAYIWDDFLPPQSPETFLSLLGINHLLSITQDKTDLEKSDFANKIPYEYRELIMKNTTQEMVTRRP